MIDHWKNVIGSLQGNNTNETSGNHRLGECVQIFTMHQNTGCRTRWAELSQSHRQSSIVHSSSGAPAARCWAPTSRSRGCRASVQETADRAESAELLVSHIGCDKNGFGLDGHCQCKSCLLFLLYYGGNSELVNIVKSIQKKLFDLLHQKPPSRTLLLQLGVG